MIPNKNFRNVVIGAGKVSMVQNTPSILAGIQGEA